MGDPFQVIKEFLLEKMRMSHIYQPLMLKVLLERGGSATIRQIAEAFLAHDESQIEYYEHIVRIWPTKTLTSHGLIERDGKSYRLALDVNHLSDSQRIELIRLCDEKITVYKEKRGREIWEHRTVGLGEISGSVRSDTMSSWWVFRFGVELGNLGNLWRRLGLSKRIDTWSLRSLQQRLTRTGGRLVKHARYYQLLLAEGHLTRTLLGAILRRLRALSVPAG